MKKITKISASALTICLAAFSLTGCGKTSIDANDYIEIKTSGIDSQGTAYALINYGEMYGDYSEAFGIDDKSNILEINSVRSKLEENLTGELDKTKELSNGDTITFRWDKNGIKKLEDKYKVKFKSNDMEIKVTDLKLAEEFDPFDHLTVTFDGYAPNGKAVLNSNGVPVSGVAFECSKKDGLSNGDTVKVTFGGADLQDVCLKQGYAPVATEKEYTVEGLTSYVQKIGDIPKEAYEKLDAHVQDTFKAYVASEWEEKDAVKSIELIGNYMLVPKDASYYGVDNNRIYFIYKITEKQKKASKDHVFYYYGSYKDICILPDGTCSFDLKTLKVPDGQYFSAINRITGAGFLYEDLFYKGYEDIDTMFNNLVTACIDNYTYETTVNE